MTNTDRGYIETDNHVMVLPTATPSEVRDAVRDDRIAVFYPPLPIRPKMRECGLL